MSHKYRLAYFAHAVRADWNNGNAHFLRGLLRALGQCGHDVHIFEPAEEWSIRNLRGEEQGERALREFAATYPDLHVIPYDAQGEDSFAHTARWRELLRDTDIVILHEWNPPRLAHHLLALREELGFRMLFHDTHHRASSSPEQIRLLGVDRVDGVLAYGEALRSVYCNRFNIAKAWTLHEAADTTVFRPQRAPGKTADVVWIGNWGDDERSSEICKFLLHPAAALREYRFTIYGVRYPRQALAALQDAGVQYGGYLPNLDGRATYAASRVTVHIPRQQYVRALTGIPTIRVFEALACGIPLVSAPWQDTQGLFRDGDYCLAHSTQEMTAVLRQLLANPQEARAQADRGLRTVLARHTCRHRAEQLSGIFEEVLQ